MRMHLLEFSSELQPAGHGPAASGGEREEHGELESLREEQDSSSTATGTAQHQGQVSHTSKQCFGGRAVGICAEN